MIATVRVWRDIRTHEVRVYIHTTENVESCKYLTGNHWHAAKSIEGKATEQDWLDAKAVALVNGSWQNYTYRAPKAAKYEDEEELADLHEPAPRPRYDNDVESDR